MPIPGPGSPITANTIQTEFGGSGPISLNEYYRSPSNTPKTTNPVGGTPNNPAVIVRNTPGTLTIPNNITAATPDVPAAQIGYADFLSTQNRLPYSITVSANAVDYNLYNNRGPLYTPGGSDIVVNIDPDVYLVASTTASAGLLVPSQFAPGDTIVINNNGVIYGKGGNGGAGGTASAPGRYPIGTGWSAGAAGAGSAGGAAVIAQRPVTINNSGTIAGGGGGGGGGGGSINYAYQPPYTVGSGKSAYTATGWYDLSGGSEGGGGGGGAGGSPTGGTGGTGGTAPYTPGVSSSGAPGTLTGAGGGGAGAAFGGYTGGAGGIGGALGSAGSSGVTGTGGNYPNAGGVGGAAGRYISGNPFVTLVNSGTLIGTVG